MKKHNRILIGLLLFFVTICNVAIPIQLYSQITNSISLEAAVDSALKNNLKIQQYQQVVSQKKYLSKAATGNFFPTIDVIGGYTYFSKNPEVNMSQVKESIDDVFGKYGVAVADELGLSSEDQFIYDNIVGTLGRLPAYNIIIDQQNYPSLNIAALQPIYLGGKVIAGKRFAEAELGYAAADLQQVKNQIIKETIQRYLSVVLLNEVVKTRREVLSGMRKHESQAEKAIKIGVIPSHELIRAQVAVAQAQRELTDDINKRDIAIVALKTSMGSDQEINYKLTDNLKYNISALNIDNLQLEARHLQPVFGMIRQQKLMVDQQYALDVSEFLPQVAAWGEYGFFREEYPVIMPPAMIGIQAKLNIFKGLSKYNKLKSTKFLSEEIIKAEEYAHNQISLLVYSTYREVLNNEEKYRKMKPTVDLAAKNLEINEKRFSEGLARSIDVIDSRLLYEGVVLERLKSLYDYYISLSDLYLATGNPEKVVEILN